MRPQLPRRLPDVEPLLAAPWTVHGLTAALWGDEDEASWADFARHVLACWPRRPTHAEAFARWVEGCGFEVRTVRRWQTGSGEWVESARVAPAGDALGAAPRARAPRMEVGRFDVPPIPTTGELARFLEVRLGHLLWLSDPRHLLRHHGAGPLQHYVARWIPKRSGGARLVEAPKRWLRSLQRRILRDVLGRVAVHPAAHGFVAGRSALTHAGNHVKRGVVLRLDLREFFPSVGRRRIGEIFRALGYPDRVADALTGLCTTCTPAATLAGAPDWRSARRHAAAHLPQGAPTSPKLANLAAYGLDVRLSAFAEANGATNSRYADDLAFSADTLAPWFEQRVAAIVADEGFRVNPSKTRRMGQGTRQEVVGLVVNAQLAVSRADRERLEAILVNCVRHGAASQNRDGHPEWRSHLEGRVAWVRQVSPRHAVRLEGLLDAIAW